MQHQQHDLDGDDQAQIWRSAQHRRTEDIRSWFAELFNRRRQLKSLDTRWHFAAMFLRSLTSQPLLPSGYRAGGSQTSDTTKGGQSGR
jgi:hypothetical protein